MQMRNFQTINDKIFWQFTVFPCKFDLTECCFSQAADRAYKFMKNTTLLQVFFVNYTKIFRAVSFSEHFWTIASKNHSVFLFILGKEVNDHLVVPYYVNSPENDSTLYQPALIFDNTKSTTVKNMYT